MLHQPTTVILICHRNKKSRMQLNLTRPLVFFDLESTGLTIGTDRIVEISILKLMPDESKQVKTRRVNPERPIPPEVSKIHGIYDADVVNEPTFKAIANSLAQFIGNADLAGYNSNKFDVPLLVDEFIRAGVDFPVTISAMRLMLPRSSASWAGGRGRALRAGLQKPCAGIWTTSLGGRRSNRAPIAVSAWG